MLEKILNIGRKIIPRRLFRWGQPVYHFLLALSGNIIYRFPGRKMICVGVTGTNGKSTTVELINSVLKDGGKKTGMISTIAFEVAEKRTDNITSHTTLGRWQTQKMLRKMVRAKCEYAVLEVASEGIKMFRTWGIPFDVAVFTNLSPEHLNTHKTMKNYRNTKGKLFVSLSTSKRKKLVFVDGQDEQPNTRSKERGAIPHLFSLFQKKGAGQTVNSKRARIKKISIVNADDREAKYFSAFPADEHFLYGQKKGDVRAENIGEKLEFSIEYQGKNYPIKSDLIGGFNVYNILAAWCVGFSQKLNPKDIQKGIFEIKGVKGRFEKVAEKDGVQYFLDYAVTPDAFELLFAELRKIASGRIIAVFGATGDRDKSKRPKLGEVAARKADIVIITDEEPYSEKPADIINQIYGGAVKIRKEGVYKIVDRKKALREAIKIAKEGDVVVATGLGHQKFRNVGGKKKISWEEGKIIKDLLK